MAKLQTLISYLDTLLDSNNFNDLALNGLQVESQRTDVDKVAFAVDSGLSIMQKAIDSGAQLLVVHHGLFWGEVKALRGAFGAKLELMFKNHLSLYASHLPLDANTEVGNAFELARHIELKNLASFFEYRGKTIGAKGRFAKARPLASIEEALLPLRGNKAALTLNFGKSLIETVGIVTGSGSSAIASASAEGLDLLLSGEPKQDAYHLAKELKLNVIFAGHYATETFGVKALAKRIGKDFDVSTIFIDEDTGI